MRNRKITGVSETNWTVSQGIFSTKDTRLYEQDFVACLFSVTTYIVLYQKGVNIGGCIHIKEEITWGQNLNEL